MRQLYALATISILVAGACYGQPRTEPGKDLPKYRVTNKDGSIIDIVSFTRKAPLYNFVLPHGGKKSCEISTVESIEDLPEDLAKALFEKSRPTSSLTPSTSPKPTPGPALSPKPTPTPASDLGSRVQPRTEARKSLGADILLPNFRARGVDGQTYDLVSYSKSPPWYTFQDTKNNRSTHAISSIAKIEKLTPVDADVAADRAASSTGRNTSVWLGPRTAPRTQARRSRPRLGGNDALYSASDPGPSSYGGGSNGDSATGLPLHVGPRGGIYHISANGNKVYHPR